MANIGAIYTPKDIPVILSTNILSWPLISGRTLERHEDARLMASHWERL